MWGQKKGLAMIELDPSTKTPLYEQLYATLADEIRTNNEELHAYLQQKLKDVPAEYMPHDALKAFSAKAKFAIRTGEFSPYPNVILRAGVVF